VNVTGWPNHVTTWLDVTLSDVATTVTLKLYTPLAGP
jgi:hypothetical protein